MKQCQICGKEMSLYYHYPNANFLKSLNKRFGTEFSDCDHISDIWDDLINQGIRKHDLATFLIDKGNLHLDAHNSKKDEIIDEVREEVDKVITKVENMNKIILNREIKRAIKTNMGVSTKGVSGKQINGIINNYKQAVGEEMNKKQVDYIKTLNNSQAQSILVTINAFKKYLRTQQATA